MNLLPMDSETCQVLAQPVGIIGAYLFLPRGMEENSTRVRQRPGISTNLDDVRQLDAVEKIHELC